MGWPQRGPLLLLMRSTGLHGLNLITSGMIAWPLMALAFIAVYVVFFRDTEKPHKEKQTQTVKAS